MSTGIAGAAPAPSAAALRRAVLASVIGNGLEWFDFVSYGFFAPEIAAAFFPQSSPLMAQLLTWATYGIGFVVRPVGGILLGLYADRAGRRAALMLLIGLMAAGTVLMGLAPSYAAAGLAGPAVVIAGRLLQGLSVGGEFASATAMLVEYAPADRRMFYASFQSFTQGVAVILAALASLGLRLALDPAALHAWGWRVPFLLGTLIGPVGFYLRRHLAESPEFEAALRQPARHPPLWSVRLGCGIGAIVFGTASTYLWSSYVASYAQTELHLPFTVPLIGVVACNLIGMAVNAGAGMLADRVGVLRVFIPAVVVAGLAAVPLLHWVLLAPSPGRLWLVQVLATTPAAAVSGCAPGLLARIFPTRIRSTGMATAYNIAVALFGGLAPFTVTSLIGLTGNRLMPGFYLLAASAVTVLTVGLLSRRVPELARR